VYTLQEGSRLIGVECVICFVEFQVLSQARFLMTRLETGYPGQNVCVTFIGVVFVIGFGSAAVAPCILLEARIWREFGSAIIGSEI
jgi:hypothetical protein